jgi:aspartyl-tRNA(Asn)/glutamyl-tRNA(Gln) amidotransferase subunit A
MAVRGWLTDAGSRALEGFKALDDATVVTRLKEARAEIVPGGRMSELGFGLDDTTGGGTLPADGADISLINDTMGEARVAAAMSGCFGFKPSWGIVPRPGIIGLVPSMECCGIAAKNVKDIIAAISTIAGADENDFSMPDEPTPDFAEAFIDMKPPLTVGVLKESLALLDDSGTRAFNAALDRLKQAGCTVEEVSIGEFGHFRTVHNVIGSVEASSSAGKYDGVRYGHRAQSAKNWNEMYIRSRGESFGPLIKTYLFQGAYFQYEDYGAFENACRIRRRLVESMTGLFGRVDFLAMPTTRFGHDASEASTINDTYDAFAYTLPSNVTGQPSLQIPSLATDGSVDPGLQLMGPRLGDARLLAMGMRLSGIGEGGERI